MRSKSKSWAWAAGVAFLCAGSGFADDGSALGRNFDRTIALTNAPVLVTATFANGGAALLHGFFYTDQLPDALTVSPVSVTLDGQSISNYLFESGWSGDVAPGCTPWRWVLETPASFAELNPIPPQGTVQISYAITSPVPGAFLLQDYSCAAFDPVATNSIFKYSTGPGQRVVFFDRPPSLLSATISPAGCALAWTAISNVTYRIQYSADLIRPHWRDLAPDVIATNNVASAIDPSPASAQRFYRVMMVP